jgi:DNA-binding GntR family transcriptional regulator
MNVVHMRLLLEPELVRLATDAATDSEVETLIDTIEKMEIACAAGDHLAWSKADTIFHEILGEACPNELLGEIVIQMRNRAHHLANIDSQTNPARLSACTAEHREIVDYVALRDGEGAAEAVRQHIGKLRESLFTRLSYS